MSESAFAEEFGSTRITMKKKGVIQSEGNTEYVYDVYGAVEYSRSGENLYYDHPSEDIYTGRYLQYDMRVTTDRGRHWTVINKAPLDGLGWYISDVKCDKDNISNELFTYHTHSGGELGWNNYAYHQYIYIRHFQAIEGVTNNYEFQVGQLLDISKRYTLNGNGYASFTNADIKGALDADGGVLYSYYLYAKNFEDIRLFYRCNVQPRLKTNRWVMAGGTMKIQHYELVNGQYKWKDYSFHIVSVRHSEGFFFTIMGFTYDWQYEIQASISESNMEGIDIAHVFVTPTNGSSGWMSQVIPPDNIGWRMNWLYLFC